MAKPQNGAEQYRRRHHRAGHLLHAQQAGEPAPRLPGPGLLQRRAIKQDSEKILPPELRG